MSGQVYANGLAICCKAAQGKSVCAFPDVCMTPPETPATPPGVPVPYPNTGLASDCSNGSTSVQISGQEVMLKNKSSFKKSSGDEAGSAPKKGIITSTNTGEVFFNTWSMDVLVEGENVVRHLDLTTHNHACYPGNSPTWPYVDTASMQPGGDCETDMNNEKTACQDFKPHGSEDLCESLKPLPYTPLPVYKNTGKPSPAKSSPQARKLATRHAASGCMHARRCFLQPYKPSGCCSPQTPHHLIEASALFDTGRGGAGSTPLQGVNSATPAYDENKAPCVCAEGITQHTGSHGWMHTMQSVEANKIPATGTLLTSAGTALPNERVQTYRQGKDNAIKAMKKVFIGSFCKNKCIEKQLDNYHNQCGINDSTQIRAVVEGNISADGLSGAQSGIAECAAAADKAYPGGLAAAALRAAAGEPLF